MKNTKQYWLMKTEPDVYSWEDLVNDTHTHWDGVRNFAARNHMRSMKKGDEVFICYSMAKDKGIVAIAKVVKEAYPDPSSNEVSNSGEPTWWCVDIAPVKKLPNMVHLKDIKANKTLSQMALVRISRLSVQPVSEPEWREVLAMAQA